MDTYVHHTVFAAVATSEILDTYVHQIVCMSLLLKGNRSEDGSFREPVWPSGKALGW